jgi:hypothetical protein
MDTIASAFCRVVTSGFMVLGFVSTNGGCLGDPVVHPHKVAVFSELGNDFSRMNLLVLPCYRGDGHEALLRSSVYPANNLIQSLVEIRDRVSLSETSTSFVPLSVVDTSSVLVVGGLVGRCIGVHIIF